VNYFLLTRENFLGVELVIAPMLMVISMPVIMMITDSPGIAYFIRQKRFNQPADFTGTATVDPDSGSLQSIQGTLTHITGQHSGNTFLAQNCRNVGFAATSPGRLIDLLHLNFPVFRDTVQGVKFAMTKMIIHCITERWNC
jgi:hypothetical protein